MARGLLIPKETDHQQKRFMETQPCLCTDIIQLKSIHFHKNTSTLNIRSRYMTKISELKSEFLFVFLSL